jgi:hypothetical protein
VSDTSQTQLPDKTPAQGDDDLLVWGMAGIAKEINRTVRQAEHLYSIGALDFVKSVRGKGRSKGRRCAWRSACRAFAR